MELEIQVPVKACPGQERLRARTCWYLVGIVCLRPCCTMLYTNLHAARNGGVVRYIQRVPAKRRRYLICPPFQREMSQCP